MLEFYERRRLKRFLYSPVILAVLAIVSAFVSSAAWSAYGKEQEARRYHNEIARELAELKEREAGLSTELERLSSERGVESELRQKFDVAREGEEIIVMVPPKEAFATTTASVPQSTSVWQRMRQAIGW